MDTPRLEPYGDAALLVTLGEAMDLALSTRVRAAATALEGLHLALPAVGAPVAGYAAVLVPFDPLATTWDEVAAAAANALVAADPAGATVEAPSIEVPTRYGGEDGPDLVELAEAHGLTVAQAIECHAGATYVVAFLGFMPGFAYLLGGPPELDHPRRATPRTRVPAGSVAVAGTQGTVYPFESPGGWNLVGRTASRPWDAGREPPALFLPGMRVRFVPDTGR